MNFKILGDITQIKTIAAGSSIREIGRLRKFYGAGRWRKMKGFAQIRFLDGKICKAEIHWYESHGIGRKEIKIKYIMNEEE